MANFFTFLKMWGRRRAESKNLPVLQWKWSLCPWIDLALFTFTISKCWSCKCSQPSLPFIILLYKFENHSMGANVDVPKSNTAIIWTPVFEWHVVRCEFGGGTPFKHVFKRGLTTCSKNVLCTMLDSQHDCGDLYDHLMSTRIFTLIMNKLFIWAPKMMRQMAMGTIWNC